MVRKVIWALTCSALACSGGERRDGRPAARAADTTTVAGVADERSAVLFFGTSLTAGLGLEPEQSFPAVLQQKFDSAGLGYRAVNAGVSGETSAAGLRRIDWLLQRPVAVLVLELGANDALRGQDLAAAKRNLQQIIDRTRARYPDVRIVVAGMEAPPNLGDRYTQEFRRLFVDLARENGAVLIPFLLEGVAGEAERNQADGIHPTAAGARIVANNVWKVLAPMLGAQRP
ncbi:MAG: arylesterase [Gemmatimonadales bacterium]